VYLCKPIIEMSFTISTNGCYVRVWSDQKSSRLYESVVMGYRILLEGKSDVWYKLTSLTI